MERRGRADVRIYREHEAIGQPITLIVPPDLYDEEHGKAFELREPFQVEYRLRRHDGEYGWVLTVGVPRYDAEGSFAGHIGTAVDIAERKQAEEALSTVSQKLIEAHEDERARIARELHDDISQQLALVSMRLDEPEATPSGSDNDPSRSTHLPLSKGDTGLLSTVQRLCDDRG